MGNSKRRSRTRPKSARHRAERSGRGGWAAWRVACRGAGGIHIQEAVWRAAGNGLRDAGDEAGRSLARAAVSRAALVWNRRSTFANRPKRNPTDDREIGTDSGCEKQNGWAVRFSAIRGRAGGGGFGLVFQFPLLGNSADRLTIEFRRDAHQPRMAGHLGGA